jgi:hypothetical protein
MTVTRSNRVHFFLIKCGAGWSNKPFFINVNPGKNHKGLFIKWLERDVIRNSHEVGTLLNAGFVENVEFEPYHEVELWWKTFFPLSESTIIVV